jgi:lipopolysaccharide heptosyltransferase I
MNFLIVRLGALGDIIHAVPAAAALRAAFPDARIDWVVDAKHRAMVDLVTVVDRTIALERSTLAGWADVARRMRQSSYDAAIDLQGLLKSAVLARASGAARVLGFSIWHLREKAARPFYSETDDYRDQDSGNARLPPDQGNVPLQPEQRAGQADTNHVIYKNLRLLRTLGIDDDRIAFPLAEVDSDALREVRAELGPARPFALINPGAAWPNKRWPSERYGEVAAFLSDVRHLRSVVLWGPGEEGLARAVAAASAGSALVAPPTALSDLLALSRAASLMVSGDTGPLHLAAAAGTPVVSIFGPTDPNRNGPWAPGDAIVSRFGSCACHYERRCHQPSDWCLGDLPVSEVTAAVQQRLGSVRLADSAE